MKEVQELDQVVRVGGARCSVILHAELSPSCPPPIPPPPQVEEFMKGGQELFTRQATSVEDIGKSGQDARAMVDGLVQVAQVGKGGRGGGAA